MLVDIPMKEYTYHDDRWFYWRGNQAPRVHIIRTRNNLMDAYQISMEEANKIAHDIKDMPDDEVAYYVNMTSIELAKQF